MKKRSASRFFDLGEVEIWNFGDPRSPEGTWGSPKKIGGPPKKVHFFLGGPPIFFGGPQDGNFAHFFGGTPKNFGAFRRGRAYARYARVRRGATPFGASHGIAHSARCCALW